MSRQFTTPLLVDRDPTVDTQVATKRYVDSKASTPGPSSWAGGATSLGTITNGTVTTTQAPQQTATITTTAPTVNAPPTAGAVEGQQVLARLLNGAASTLLFTLAGQQARAAGYPASLQVPAGKRARVLWEYTALGTAGWTAVVFNVEQ